MSENTRTCALCCSTPTIALTQYQLTTKLQGQTQYEYVSTFQGTTNKTYQYKSQTERIQALQGRLSLGNCGFGS